jgi:hypothetical protein
MSQTTADKIYISSTDISNWTHFCDTLRLKNRKTLSTKLILYGGAAQILQRSRSHLKILGSRRARWNTLHAEDAQTLDTIVKKLSPHGDQWPRIYVTLSDGNKCCPIPLHKSVILIWEIPKILSRHHTPYISYTAIWSSTRRGRRTKLNSLKLKE